MITVAVFDTIRQWHEQGMSTREIARRLHADVKTVRRHLAKIKAGATLPQRTSPGSKLDPYLERIAAAVEAGRTGWSIYQELSADPAFPASYELLKKHIARTRKRSIKIYERLNHQPTAEAQCDFGELVRVMHQGKLMRVWAFVAIWCFSRWRYAEVVLDQTVPTFLSCIQNGIRESGAIPVQWSIDNLASGVLRHHFYERAYQQEFAKLCAHYDMMPNAVRPRTPTDKGLVENGVGSLKKFLRGLTITSLQDVRDAVAGWARTGNERVHSTTHKRPNDLLAQERRHTLPEPFPIAAWSEHRVRTDCHIQVLYNFYSVPHELVGKKVTVRLDAAAVTIYDAFLEVARWERRYGKGHTSTNRAHYPPHKRPATQQVHHERTARIRAVGAGAAAFLAGLEQSREYVHSDSRRALLKLVESTDAAILDRACARAAHFGSFSLATLRGILDQKLYDIPLDEPPVQLHLPILPSIEIVRSLDAYAALIGDRSC